MNPSLVHPERRPQAEVEGRSFAALRLVLTPAVGQAGGIVRTGIEVFSVVVLLSLVSAVPALSVLALGYLLDAQGRVQRRERSALAARDAAPALLWALVKAWLLVLPVRLVWAAAQDARVIAPEGTAWRVLAGITVVGGGAALSVLGRRVWQSRALIATRLRALEPLRLLAAAVKAAVAALVWLALPTGLWAIARNSGAERPGLALLGGALLVPVLLWLPFLQAQFAATGAWRDLASVRTIRRAFTHAPLAFVLALAATFVLTLPLWLLKVVLPPRDAAWLVTPVFIATILPVRLLTAWALRRAAERAARVSRFITWPARATAVLLAVVYAGLLFLTPLVDAHGSAALLRHHAFLLPTPFF